MSAPVGKPPARKAVWRVSDLAFVLAGFAVVVSVACMVYVRKQMLAFHDQLGDVQRQLVEVKAQALTKVQPAPTAAGDDEEDVPLLPADLLAKVQPPAEKGGRVTARVPIALYAAVRNDPRSLTTEASMLPDAANQDGFVLFEVRPGGLADKLGFKQGDKIKTVAGKPFTTTSQVVDVWESLGDAPPKTISFGIVRAEQPLTIDVDLVP